MTAATKAIGAAKKIDPFVAKQYGGAHGFRAAKRAELRTMRSALELLRSGCAYLPNGSEKVMQISRLLTELQDECSVKNWGR
jgi:hypothetical protein